MSDPGLVETDPGLVLAATAKRGRRAPALSLARRAEHDDDDRRGPDLAGWLLETLARCAYRTRCRRVPVRVLAVEVGAGRWAPALLLDAPSPRRTADRLAAHHARVLLPLLDAVQRTRYPGPEPAPTRAPGVNVTHSASRTGAKHGQPESSLTAVAAPGARTNPESPSPGTTTGAA